MKKSMYLYCAMALFGPVLNGQSWNALGAGLNGPVYEIYIHEDDVYAGGYFFDAGGKEDADFLARWDGCEWHAVAPGLNNSVNAIAVIGDRVYVSGNFTDVGGDADIDRIAFWDGTQWHPLVSGVDYFVSDMEVIGTDLYVGGGFNRVGVELICMIARWDGSDWHALGPGAPFCAYDFTDVTDLATDGDNLYITGMFWNMGGIESADRVAKWDGEMWHALGEGISPAPSWSNHLTMTVHNQNVYVAGSFTNAGNNEEADYLVSWDGHEWEGLVTSLADSNARMPFIYKGVLHAVFGNEIRKLIPNDGWSLIAHVDELYTLESDGDNLYVGGFFNTIDSQQVFSIARWSELESCSTTSTMETHNSNAIKIYPNPTAELILFEMNEQIDHGFSVTIYSTTGQTVLNKHTTIQEIDISSLPAGMYMISIHDGIQAWKGRFVKK